VRVATFYELPGILTTDTTDGFAFTVDVNLDGTTTVNNFSVQTNVELATSGIPEPGSLALAGMGISLSWALRLRKRRRCDLS
jgi:hypothetical protein